LPKVRGEKGNSFPPAEFQCPENKKGITAVHAHLGSWSGYAFDLQSCGSGRQGSSGFYDSFFRGLIVLSRIILYAFIIFGSFPNQSTDYFMEPVKGPEGKFPLRAGGRQHWGDKVRAYESIETHLPT
jgi:hypothetical protein